MYVCTYIYIYVSYRTGLDLGCTRAVVVWPKELTITSIYIYMGCVYVYTCVYVCIYIYIYIYKWVYPSLRTCRNSCVAFVRFNTQLHFSGGHATVSALPTFCRAFPELKLWLGILIETLISYSLVRIIFIFFEQHFRTEKKPQGGRRLKAAPLSYARILFE